MVIGNLIRNACSYTDIGEVRITIEARTVRITDSGVGIQAADIDQVFKPYFRAQPRRRGGYGVGLTIVKRLTDRFGWQLHIESSPGLGTDVTIEFPDILPRQRQLHALFTPH